MTTEDVRLLCIFCHQRFTYGPTPAGPDFLERRLVQATAEGKTVEWQADRSGDFHAVIEETR